MRKRAGFSPIGIKEFVKLHMKSNLKDNPVQLTANLQDCLSATLAGKRCYCGEPIWVIGSAFAGPQFLGSAALATMLWSILSTAFASRLPFARKPCSSKKKNNRERTGAIDLKQFSSADIFRGMVSRQHVSVAGTFQYLGDEPSYEYIYSAKVRTMNPEFSFCSSVNS